MKKNFLVIALAVVIVGLILTGCGASDTITLWNPFTGGDGEYFQEIVDAYNATDPNMQVEAIITPDIYTKVYTTMNSSDENNIPDLLVGHVERIPLFVEQQIINPIDEAISAQDNINGNNYLPQTWEAGEIDGKRYSVPLDIHSILLYYNVDLVEKYAPGVMDDKIITWDEVMEIVPKASADGIVTFPVRCSNWLVNCMVDQLGGSIHDGDIPTLDTPEARQALQTLVNITERGG
ncbi:MAG: ABC transporter substrate-binding protein [Lachnospirales bacterium]